MYMIPYSSLDTFPVQYVICGETGIAHEESTGGLYATTTGVRGEGCKNSLESLPHGSVQSKRLKMTHFNLLFNSHVCYLV